jgi:hypothetical protein
MAFLMLLRRMKRDHLTAHGFRSTFRDWAAERTSYPNEVAEMALAHRVGVGDKVEGVYRRGDLFEKRRRLIDEWAKYSCMALPGGGSQKLEFPLHRLGRGRDRVRGQRHHPHTPAPP